MFLSWALFTGAEVQAIRAIVVALHAIIHPGPGAEKIHYILKVW